MLMQAMLGGNAIGKTTQTAGTVINVVVPPHASGKTRISKMVYGLPYPNNSSSGAEFTLSHSITGMRPNGRTTLAAAAAASQAVIVLTADPGAATNSLNRIGVANLIAANDHLVIQQDDGSVFYAKVYSVSGLSITLVSNLGAALSAGAKVWFYGIITDTDTRTNKAHEIFRCPINQTANQPTVYSDDHVGVLASHGDDEPLLLQSSNTVDQGYFDQVSYVFTKF